MRLRMITEHGGNLYPDRSVHAYVGADTTRTYLGRLQALARSLDDLPPYEDIWCHHSVKGLILDAADDYRTGFGCIDWEQQHYRVTMFWPLQMPPRNHNMLWACAHAKLIGSAPTVTEAGHMLSDLLHICPRVAPMKEITARKLVPTYAQLARSPWAPVRPYIDHQLDTIQQVWQEPHPDVSVSQQRARERMRALVQHLQRTIITDKLWVDWQEHDLTLDLRGEHDTPSQ